MLKPDAYLLVRKKQMELFEKYRKNASVQDLVSEAIKKGINLIVD